MPFNLLLIPLVAGFLFVTKWKRTAFVAARSDRTRLVFYASLAGIALVIISRTLVLFLSSLEVFALPIDWWKSVAPFQYSGTAFLSLFVSLAGFMALNKIDRKSEYELITEWIAENGNGLETFILEAIERADADGTMVMLTLDDNKVYVGWVLQGMRDPDEPEAYVSMTPVVSGYRDAETKKVTFTNSYHAVIESLGEEESSYIEFKKIIPIARFASIGYFDPDVFLRFQENSDAD